MRIIRWGLAILVMSSVMAGAWASEQAPKEIRLVSDVWRDYTHTDGTGLAWEIMREVFEPAGVAMKIQSMPYTRSIGLVQRGEADAWVGSYRDEVSEGVFYPKWNYDNDQIVALGLRDKPTPTLDDLDKYHLVWVRGYGYDDYLPKVGLFREVQRRGGILRMLDLGHADFYIDAVTEIDEVLGDTQHPDRYRVTKLIRLPMVLGFADTPRGHQLAKIYDQRMDVLVKDGTLRPIFERWQQPYPFD